MDFNALKQKFGEFTKTATEKAKELGDKALEFAGDNIVKTGLYLHSPDEYAKTLENKKAVIIAYDDRNPIESEIVKLLAVWQTKSLIESSSLRYLTHATSDVLILEKNYALPLEMRVFFEGNEIYKTNSLEDVKNFWNLEFRDYAEKENLFKALREKNEKMENPEKTDIKEEKTETPNTEEKLENAEKTEIPVDPLASDKK